MITNSFPEYVFIRTCIAGLRAIAPLSFIYILACWYEHRFFYSRWLGLYALAEACFYLLVYLPRSFLLQKVSSSVPTTHVNHPPCPKVPRLAC